MNKIFIKAHIKKSADEKSYRFLASTSSIDRQGDSIDQKGWELRNFMNNPVILWAHRYDELPLGKVIELSVTESGLEAEIVFADESANPKAQQVKELVDQGILNAVSVGFIPKERSGNIITSAELLEISIVPVPANQDALALAYKEMDLGLKKDIEDALSGGKADDEKVTDVVPPKDDPIDEGIALGDDKEEKSGRVISSSNKKALVATRDAMKTALSEIEKLLALAEVATPDEDAESKSNYVVISRNVIEQLKSQLRYDNRTKEGILSALKNL